MTSLVKWTAAGGSVAVFLLALLSGDPTSEHLLSDTAPVRTVDLGIPAHEHTGHSDWNTPVSMDDKGNVYVVFNDERLRVVCLKIGPENRITWGVVSTGVSNDPGHNTPSIAVDGDGYVHVWYDMHSDEMRLKKSAAPNRVDAGWLRERGPWSTGYTYPAASVADNGDIYFAVRRKKGWTCQLFHYDLSEGNWKGIADFGRADGYTCYLPRPYTASDGKVHLSFQWRRGEPGPNRHVGSYAVYDPVEDTFSKADGTRHTLPITPGTADAYQPLEASWDNEYGISDTGITVNDRGQPLIVYNFFRNGRRDQRVVRLARWNGSRWVRTDLAGAETGFTLGDADIVNRNGRINIFYNDARDRLAWRRSVDGGGNFSSAATLTRNPTSSPWVHVGPLDGVTEEPVLVCNTGPDTTCKVLFVSYDS